MAARGAAADDDIVDFGIEVAGEVTTTVEVKGSASASCNELHPGEAHKVFARLAPGPGRQAFPLTNRPLSTGLLAKCVETDAAGDLWKQWSYLSDDTSSEGSGADQVIRLDERTLDELAESIASSVREFRRDRDFSQGESTARIVSIILLHRIFGAAAGDGPSTFDALEIVKLLWMPDDAIAHAIGSFDWGVPVTGIPTFTSTVPRLELLNVLAESLRKPTDVARPTAVVAHGQTGHGKSALAADFSTCTTIRLSSSPGSIAATPH